MHDTKQFTPTGYAIVVVTILLGLIVQAMLRSGSNLQSVIGALLTAIVLSMGLLLALGVGQKKE